MKNFLTLKSSEKVLEKNDKERALLRRSKLHTMAANCRGSFFANENFQDDGWNEIKEENLRSGTFNDDAGQLAAQRINIMQRDTKDFANMLKMS